MIKATKTMWLFFNYMSNVTINRLQANTVYFTLAERTTIPSPVYLFSFTCSALEGKTKNFIAQDIQTTTMLLDGARNKFVITEVAVGSESLLTGSVNLQPEGQWNYKIYAQSSTTNLNPASATELVEEGIVFVLNSATEPEFNEYTDQPLTENYYNPEE